MRITLLSLLTLAFTGALAQNTCDEALAVEAGYHTVDMVDGELPSQFCANMPVAGTEHGEWYTYTAGMDYTITITTSLEENEGLDTRIHVYSGTCGDFTCIAGDDDGGSVYLSIVSFPVEQGETVYFVWDDRWSDAGFAFELIESEFVPMPITFTPVSNPGPGSNRAMVDMNGDYLDDVVKVSENEGIHISYQNADGTLTPTAIGNIPGANFPYWSLTAGDIDGNGFNDLIYGGGSGVTFMFANEDGTAYTELTTNEYVFCQRGNCVDINNDGHLDVFMCHDVEPNVYYINDGEGNLTFYQGGLGETPNGGNYGSIWVDYDHDGDTDMFIAKCRGGSSPAKINQMHRHDGEGNYEEVGAELDMDDPVQTWSSAWGDYDNDGDLDVFIGASSFTDGSHKLLMNDGVGNFTDVSEGSGVEGITSTGIENTTHDFDNDGYLDLLGMGNKLLIGNGDMTFTVVSSDIDNGAIGDVNNDGFLDVLNSSIMMNDGNDNNFIKLNMLGTESNLNGIGAMVHIYTADLGVLTRQVRSGDGFRYMSSLNLHFGLGDVESIDSLVVDWPSGIHEVHTNIDVNTTTNIIEGSTLTSVTNAETIDVVVFPNPAADKLIIDTPEQFQNMKYNIFDIQGRMVDQGNVPQRIINVSQLETGQYVLQLDLDGNKVEKSFVKQ